MAIVATRCPGSPLSLTLGQGEGSTPMIQDIGGTGVLGAQDLPGGRLVQGGLCRR